MRIGQKAVGRMLAAALLAAASMPALAMDSVEVEMDNARLLKVPEGTDTIVIGNPLIADVTVQRNNVMVVTGKLYGTTNMIALDNKGAIISESRLVVSAPQKDRLVLLRGGVQETYSCSPNCGPVLQIGDADANFNRAMTQATQRAAGIKNAGVDRSN